MSQNLAPANFTRRQSITALGATALAASALPGLALAQTASPSLGALAAAKGLRFGTAISASRTGILNPDVTAIVIRECNIIVPENELKMYVTHNTNPTDYNFAPGDAILNFAEEHKMAMRGHNLIWARDEYTPKWLKDYKFSGKAEAEKMLRDYIARVTRHYGTRLTSWDVVNETIDPKTGEVRANAFTRVLGIDSLRIAFEAARENLPQMQLVYNDYMSWETGNETHRKGVLKLLHWFRDNKVPVDALGVQSHIGNGFDLLAAQVNDWKDFLDEVTGMGYDLLVTEFDVDDATIPTSDIDKRDAIVATVGRLYLDQILSYTQTKDVLCWGMDDKFSWLQDFTPRKDGVRLRPTPYDDNFKPKPLREAIADAFKTAPARG
ncbi:endo-1,4-beta-xylanase [Asticcacaulis sp. EMRT-3]|uniref:endo-1,4-beta-xylanase n=1 Tax=Asticcacaulis sp. EMRT-3 TaxID=3040349 RepID=UPI0024AEA768|nr:endo-1,4-beta-xylanase [Asticcacaulis sp. EMRT-3]MDI7774170.1 endo-1,4-beta-xylanase [Asticcacaulis sp. EMRT-3]